MVVAKTAKWFSLSPSPPDPLFGAIERAWRRRKDKDMNARPYMTTATASALRRQMTDGAAANSAGGEAQADAVRRADADGTVVVADVGAAHWVFHGNFQDYRDVRPGDLWAWLLSGSMYRVHAPAV